MEESGEDSEITSTFRANELMRASESRVTETLEIEMRELAVED